MDPDREQCSKPGVVCNHAALPDHTHNQTGPRTTAACVKALRVRQTADPPRKIGSLYRLSRRARRSVRRRLQSVMYV